KNAPTYTPRTNAQKNETTPWSNEGIRQRAMRSRLALVPCHSPGPAQRRLAVERQLKHGDYALLGRMNRTFHHQTGTSCGNDANGQLPRHGVFLSLSL